MSHTHFTLSLFFHLPAKDTGMATKSTDPTQPNKPKKLKRKYKQLKRRYEKFPEQVKIIFNILGTVALFGFFIVMSSLIMTILWLFFTVPWLASGLSLALFLLMLSGINGWTKNGTYLFWGAIGLTTLLDYPGNPIYYRPFEKLFLEEGQCVSGTATIEKSSAGETVLSGNNVIVDAAGDVIYDIIDFHVFLYRLAFYAILYGSLITIRGFLPKGEVPKNQAAWYGPSTITD